MSATDARARVREAGGAELLERLDHLDAVKRASRAPDATSARLPAPREDDAMDADVVIAGGGLWSMIAPLLARRGLRVVVVERARAAQSHREWNASGPELDALVAVGLLDCAVLERLVVARYAYGTCRFAAARPTR